jgi:hypothetical protein
VRVVFTLVRLENTLVRVVISDLFFGFHGRGGNYLQYSFPSMDLRLFEGKISKKNVIEVGRNTNPVNRTLSATPKFSTGFDLLSFFNMVFKNQTKHNFSLQQGIFLIKHMSCRHFLLNKSKNKTCYF